MNCLKKILGKFRMILKEEFLQLTDLEILEIKVQNFGNLRSKIGKGWRKISKVIATKHRPKNHAIQNIGILFKKSSEN